MSKSLRLLSITSRSSPVLHPLTHSKCLSHRDYGTANVRSVKIIPRDKLTVRLFKLGAKFSAVAVLGLVYLGYMNAGEEEEEQTNKANRSSRESQSDGEEVTEEEVEVPDIMPEDATFIPLTWPHPRPLEYYKGSDPEWQSFIDFKRDRKREQAVQKDLAVLVGHHFGALPPVQTGLGTPITIRQIWLDVMIPEGPPLEYERTGLEITDDYIALTTRPMSASQRARLITVLFPIPVAKALWASSGTYWSLQVAKMKSVLNISSDSDDNHSAPSSDMISLDPQEDETEQAPQAHAQAQINKMSDPKATAAVASSETPKSTPPDDPGVLGSLPFLPKPGGDMSSAMTEFKKSLAKNWKSGFAFGERGTLIISGLVQLEGPKGVLVIDVAAAYHPQDLRYTHVTGGVRNYRPKRQRPRGGS